MPRQPSVPSYRLHKNSGQAIVTIRLASGERKDVYLGPYNTPESRKEYARIIAEMASAVTPQSAGTPGQLASNITIDEMLAAFMRWAITHYRDADGKPTSEVDEVKRSLAPLRRLFGATPATEFGPRSLTAVRQEMIHSQWCRTLINRRIDRVKRAFRWATSEELIPVTVYTALRTLTGLARGRTEDRESEPVLPVEPVLVATTLPHMNRQVHAMVQLQTFTGMRPGEVRKFTFAEVEQTENLWWFRPSQHKTAHRGKTRAIPLGPRALPRPRSQPSDTGTRRLSGISTGPHRPDGNSGTRRAKMVKRLLLLDGRSRP